MPYLLIIIERESKLLIMPEDIPAHIRFHPRPHDMPEIRNIKIAEDLQQHQGDHQCTELKDRSPGPGRVKINDLIGDISDHQRYNQRYRSPQDCKKHVAVEQLLIGAVVSK